MKSPVIKIKGYRSKDEYVNITSITYFKQESGCYNGNYTQKYRYTKIYVGGQFVMNADIDEDELVKIINRYYWFN